MSLNNLNRREQPFWLWQKRRDSQSIPDNYVMFGRRWNGALGRTAMTRSRRDLQRLHCRMELSLLIECQGWAERAMARLEDQHQGSCREIELRKQLACSPSRRHGTFSAV